MSLYCFKDFVNENRSQAEALLRKKGKGTDDEIYLKLKEMLVKDNSIGYLGWMTMMVFEKHIPFNKIKWIYDEIKANQAILKELPQSLIDYTDMYTLDMDLESAKSKLLIKAFITQNVYNKELRKDFATKLQDDRWYIDNGTDLIRNINDLKAMGVDQMVKFLKKSNRFTNAEDFIMIMYKYIQGMDYDVIKEKLSNISNQVVIRLDDSEKEIILVQVRTYSAMQKLGSQLWCIQYSQKHWVEYVDEPASIQYILFHFKAKHPSDSCMGFTMSQDNEIVNAHDKDDGNIKDLIKGYIKSLGILPKLYELNRREVAQTRHKKRDIDVAIVDRRLRNDKREKNIFDIYVEVNKQITHKEDILNAFYNQYNQDLIVKRFASLNVLVVPYNNDTYYENPTSEELISLYDDELKEKDGVKIHTVPYLLHFLEDELSQIETHKDDVELFTDKTQKEFMAALSTLYKNQRERLDQQTTFGFLAMLKKGGENILRLSMDAKSKSGDEYSASEFGMASKQGVQLKPHIQNKINKALRGEDVDFSTPEIKYAIENGYKLYFMKSYTKLLSDPFERIEYDDLAIIKMLGLEDKLDDMMLTKGEFGIDQLNSIELSIYQHAKKKKGL